MGRLVHSPSRPSSTKDPSIDVINVAARTDVRRLSGMVFARWSEGQEVSSSPPVLLQAMGPQCINTLVRALALTWQKSARSHEVDEAGTEPGFFSLPSHIRLADDAP